MWAGSATSGGGLSRRPLRRLQLPLRRGHAPRARLHLPPAPARAAQGAQARGRDPKRYQGVSFDRAPVTLIDQHVVRDVRRYVDALEQRLEEGKGIWFQGDVGTGKTTLAMLISTEALRHGHSVAIYSLPRLLGAAARDVQRRVRELAEPAP